MNVNKGLQIDGSPIDKDNGSWVKAKNILMEQGFKSIKNETGFDENVTTDMPIIGRIETPTVVVIFSCDDTNLEIGIFDGSTYTRILDTDATNHVRSNPISGVYRYNHLGELIIAWWSGIEDSSDVPYILNTDDLPFDVSGSLELVNTSEIVRIQMFPEVISPNININTSINSQSRLECGVYEFIVSYIISDNNYTNWIKVSNTIPVAELATGLPVRHSASSSAVGEIVNKTIIINVKDLDSRYKGYRLGVVKTIDGDSSVRILQNIAKPSDIIGITWNDIYNFTNSSIGESISINDYLIDTISLLRIKTGTVLDNELKLGNFNSANIDYQKYANNAKVGWRTNTTINPTEHMADEKYTLFNDKSFCPDEIYAIYIAPVLKTGELTPWCHIPGRIAELFDYGGTDYYEYVRLNGTNPDGEDGAAPYGDLPSGASSYDEKYIHNPTNRDDSLVAWHHVNDTANSDLITGNKGGTKLSYTENENEYYPQDDEAFEVWDVDGNGNGIRKTGITNGIDNWAILQQAPIAAPFDKIKVRHHKMPGIPRLLSTNSSPAELHHGVGLIVQDIKFPVEILNQINGYYIGYAKRDYDNITIIGHSPILHHSQFDVSTGNGIDTTNGYRLYSFNTLQDSALPKLNLTHIGVEYQVSGSTSNLMLYMPNGITPSINKTGLITTHSYMPEDNSAVVPINTSRERCLHVKLSGSTQVTSEIGRVDDNPGHLISMRSFIIDMYYNFAGRAIASTGNYIPVQSGVYTYNYGITNAVDIILGGDIILSYDSQRIIRPSALGGPKLDVDSINYSTYIGLLKHADIPSGFPIFGGSTPNMDASYNLDYSRLNDKKVPIANDYLNTIISTFPNRIRNSDPQGSESLLNSWRLFRPDSYYDMPTTKGEIWKLATLSNKDLLIHHKYTLYHAKIKDTLITDNITAYLGTGDLFDRPPDEIITTDNGYIGTQSQWANFVCKYGYVCVDKQLGRIFIYATSGLNELSLGPNKEFFQSMLELTNLANDNPFTGTGICAGYDPTNDTIFFCKKDNLGSTGDSFTISYNMGSSKWICMHDWIADSIFNIRGSIHSIKNTGFGDNQTNRIFTHNSPTLKGLYYSDQANDSRTPYPWYIDIVVNTKPTVDKVIQAIKWQTDNIDPTGVNIYDKTINGIMIYTDSQCSGIVPVNADNIDWFDRNSGRGIQNGWFFNNFRDGVLNNKLPIIDDEGNVITSNVQINSKDWFDLSKFITKFMVIRLQGDNPIYDTDKQDKIILTNIDVKASINHR